MSKLLTLGLLLRILSIAKCSDTEEFETFIVDLIDAWKLRSPTLIARGDLPQVCMRLEWVLCLPTDSDTNELVEHLAAIHKQRKQDGIIFLEKHGHEKVLKQVNAEVPTMLTSNYPTFMPTSYKDEIKLRLDSNVLFYENRSPSRYDLYDIFAVKGGPPITEKLGNWDMKKGISLLASMSRWDRRTDMNGVSFINALNKHGIYSDFIRDENGHITDSRGMFQDQLFYILEKLNVTIEIVEAPWGDSELYENGSYGGEIGMLQREEVDVNTAGLGINLERSFILDFPVPTSREPITLIAAIPKGMPTNFWAYVSVFGVTQWIISLALLMLVVTGISLTNALTTDESDREFGTKKSANKGIKLNSTSSGFALVYLYTMQMGSHTNSKQKSSKILTLTTSFLTMLMFVYYTTDITADMTSGPPQIQIRTFQDVIHHNYKVVTATPYYENILASAEPGTAKSKVFNGYFESKNDMCEAMTEVVTNPKTVCYANPSSQIGRCLGDQTFALEMDDAVYAISSLGLQKDSEFLQIFNYYILKGIESGCFKRLYRNYHMDLHTKEYFEITEAQPLGYENVLFCFIGLTVGIIVSILKGMFEFLTKKLTTEQREKTVYLSLRPQDGVDGGVESLPHVVDAVEVSVRLPEVCLDRQGASDVHKIDVFSEGQ